jgi:uncharacterized protein YjbI with pentapeptide repeats
MPEDAAKKASEFPHREEKLKERLATPEELAEYGPIAADPAVEAQILALFEEQLNEDSVEPEITETVEQIDSTDGTGTESEAQTETETESQTTANWSLEDIPAETEEVAEEKSTPATSELELVPEPSAAPGELLEVAEALDQHRLWIESGGKEGARGDFSGADLEETDLTGANLQGAQLHKAKLRGADLSMANLRNANLVEADLRDANLLGTEFSGANLMGANLYGSQGLWLGRMGGTNLFDASLPEAVAALSGSKTIAQFTQSARWFYLMLMAMCVGACALVGMTTDVRLLLDESALRTARIPNILPLQGFYLGTPLLLTIFNLRLQFLLLRLWGSMGGLPAVFPDGQTPEKDGRWYLMGPIRPFLRWSRDPRLPLGMVESYVAVLLAFWAVPATLFLFWLRYLVLQDYRGTLLHVVLFTTASAGACASPRIVKRVLRPGDWADESTSEFLHDVYNAIGIPALAGFVLFLMSLGVIRGLPGDSSLRTEVGKGDPRRWAATIFQTVGYRPYANLTDENISTHHADMGNSDSPSNEASGPRLNEIDLRYARGYHAEFANARMWRANLEGASLAEVDFREANLRESNLRSASMDRVRAEKANLVSVDAQGATFAGGLFQNADLSYANLQGATLTTANLTHATLYAVNLRAANLLRAELSHADLRDTKLEGAVLSLATLEQTDLSAAKLMRVNATGAQFKGTILLESDLSMADLRGATFPGAVLRQVKLDGANLMGADLRGTLGLEAWQVCSAQGWRGAQLDVDVKLAVEQSCGTAQQTQQQ